MCQRRSRSVCVPRQSSAVKKRKAKTRTENEARASRERDRRRDIGKWSRYWLRCCNSNTRIQIDTIGDGNDKREPLTGQQRHRTRKGTQVTVSYGIRRSAWGFFLEGGKSQGFGPPILFGKDPTWERKQPWDLLGTATTSSMVCIRVRLFTPFPSLLSRPV